MKIWIITAACMIVVGLLLLGGVVMAGGFELQKLSTVNYVTNTYQPTEPFLNIEVDTDTADVVFMPSDSEACRVVCYEQDRVRHQVEVRDGTLFIEARNQRKWYDFIGINWGSPKVTVYLPAQTYDALSVTDTTGDVRIPGDFTFESIGVSVSTGHVRCAASALGQLRIHVTTGDVELTDNTCRKLICQGSTGDIRLVNVIASEELLIKMTTGDVRFDDCDAPQISVKLTTGDVTGTLLSGKTFIANTTTGRIRVPQDTAGGKCQITTTTGDINISVP